MTTTAAQRSDSTRCLTSQTVLFLCTGNYYRSRFAEEVFNHFASAQSLPFCATSLGFTPHPDINPGPISTFTLRALDKLSIRPLGATRMPTAVAAEDFNQHTHCISLCEREHRPMMERMFPQHVGKVRFWHVEDLAFENPTNAANSIVNEIQKLIDELVFAK